MKYVGIAWMVIVFVFCFALMAYAEEDKTEMVKAQAIAEAEAKLQPLANKVKDQFDEVLKDRKLGYTEMDILRKAIVKYQTNLDTANKHLAVYKTSLASEVYPPAVKLTKLYFTIFFLSDGGWHHQDEMRLLVAKEGVGLQDIESVAPIGFVIFLAFCFIIALLISESTGSAMAALWAVILFTMAIVAVFFF